MRHLPICGRCAERLPCACLGLARRELEQLHRELREAAGIRLVRGKNLAIAMRGRLRKTEPPRPLWELALEARKRQAT